MSTSSKSTLLTTRQPGVKTRKKSLEAINSPILSKFKPLPSIKLPVNNIDSKSKLLRSKSQEIFSKNDLLSVKENKRVKALSPVRLSKHSPHRKIRAVNRPIQVSPLSSPAALGRSTEPRRFTFGISQSLPASGGNRRESIGDYNNNWNTRNTMISLNSLGYQNNQIILPRLFDHQPVNSAISLNNKININTNMKKSKSTNNIDTTANISNINIRKDSLPKTQFRRNPSKDVLINLQTDLTSHILNERQVRSKEHFPSVKTHYSSDPKYEATKIAGVKQSVFEDYVNNVQTYTNSKNTVNAIKLSESPPVILKDIKTCHSESIKCSPSSNQIKLPSKDSTFILKTETPRSKTAFSSPKKIVHTPRVDVSNGTPVTITGRVLKTTKPIPAPAQRPASVELINNITTGSEEMKNTSKNNTSADHKNDSTDFRPKLVRSRTFDVIDTKMQNLPVVDLENEDSELTQK